MCPMALVNSDSKVLADTGRVLAGDRHLPELPRPARLVSQTLMSMECMSSSMEV